MFEVTLWRRRFVRDVFGETFGDDDFVGVNVDAARRFTKELLLRRLAFIGDDGIVVEPIRKLVIDAVSDCVFILSTGATVGAEYISGILGTGGALTGVVNVLALVVFIEGNDFFILLSATALKKTYFRALVGEVGTVLLVAPSASAVPKLAFAFVNLMTSYTLVLSLEEKYLLLPATSR